MNAQEYLAQKKIDSETMDMFGLTITGTGSLSIPIKDKDGNTLFRKFRNFSGTAKYLYELGTTAQLFGINLIKDEHKWVIVTEGEMEVITLAQSGIPAVSSTGGCGTFKEEWADHLQGKQAVIMYDNDQAGLDGSQRVYRILTRKGIKCSIRRLSGEYEAYKDFGEIMAQEGSGGVRQALKTSITYEYVEEVKSKVQTTYKEVVGRLNGKDNTFSQLIGWAKRYDVNRLLSEHGHQPVERNGDEYKYLCISHHEKSGSMVVYPDGHTYCFGCAKYGDSISILQELEKISFKDAVYKLVDKL